MSATRKKAGAATQAGGNPSVVAHPSFREIPKCQFPLRHRDAKKEYLTLSQILFDAGHLTISKHRALSSYCMQFDNILMAPEEGKTVRGSWVQQMEKARNSLDLDDLTNPIAAPESAKANKFASAGFASRCR